MTSTPAEPNQRVEAAQIDLKTVPIGGEKQGAKAESPMTAMELATSKRKEESPLYIRGVSIPRKPDPPGTEGERKAELS
jgi:queuine/archaeosine tRNA-ribosyltransferase